MAAIVIHLTIPDAHSNRFIMAIDNVWPGRLLQDPVPTEEEWAKMHIVNNIKQQILKAEKEAQNIDEIEID